MVGGKYVERLGTVLQFDWGQYSNMVMENAPMWLVDQCKCFSVIARECLCMFKGSAAK